MYTANSLVELPFVPYPQQLPRNQRAVTPVTPAAEISGEEYGDVVLSLFEKSGIGLAVLDPALRVRASNQVFSEQCGRPREAIRNQSFLAFLHLSVRQNLLRQFERLVQGRPTRAACHSLAARFEGTDVTGQLAAFPVDDATGRIRMIVVQFAPERVDETVPVVREQRKLTALTARILEGVAAGDPTVRLAAKLFLSRQGIEYHVSILLRQFKVPNRTALAAKAYSMGVFSIGCWPPKVLPEYIRS
ncbi:PAS domain-containing protein [Micromonospora siamensis]|uniref:Regulatory protein, luxR family n=1 Tax=Micromonospora siamensis TaxID=299152 RepID=A0A1C5I997_9ACTN|nr:PAS domain-containing protein [Micromonospora siamensis]SCG54679.1 regulatory protein, luxR family [Micromonospora siamensis]